MTDRRTIKLTKKNKNKQTFLPLSLQIYNIFMTVTTIDYSFTANATVQVNNIDILFYILILSLILLNRS